MPNNSSKAKSAKKQFKVTPQIRAAYAKRNRALDSDPDARPLPPEKWVKAMTRPEFEKFLATQRRTPKKLTSVRIDADVVDWLKSKGTGHISRVNDILRAAMLVDQKR